LNKSTNHTRTNDILLGPLERPALNWLASHSPSWATPDIYTGIGIIGGFTILIGYILSRFHPGFFWLSTLGFILNWFGDSLDGTLARHRHIERPIYGFYIDHVTDAIVEVMVFLGLALSPYIHFEVAMLSLVAYLLMSVLVYVRTCVVSDFKISYGKLGPTEARFLAILLNIAMFTFGELRWPVEIGNLGSFVINPYDLFVGAIGLLIFYFFFSTSIQEAIKLGKANC
jgi:phosphatidylglycerophosphate synthase